MEVAQVRVEAEISRLQEVQHDKRYNDDSAKRLHFIYYVFDACPVYSACISFYGEGYYSQTIVIGIA